MLNPSFPLPPQIRLEHARFAKAGKETTSSAILGPFYRTGVPAQPNDTSIIRKNELGADYTYLHGVVTGSDGQPLKGATVDVWHDVSRFAGLR